MRQVDQENFIEELKKGNNQVLASLFEAHERYCTRTLLKKTRCSIQDAEDLFVDSILNLRERILAGKLTKLSNIRSYLFSTCYYNWLKMQKRERVKISKEEEIKSWFYNAYESFGLGEEVLYQEEMMEKVQKCWKKLKKKCQQLIHYFYVKEMSMKEIAVRLNYANSNVAKTSKQRCFKHLLELIAGSEPDKK